MEEQLPHFVLPKPLDPDDIVPLKALGELARTGDLLCRRRDLPPEERARFRALLEFAWREFGEGQVFVERLDIRPLPLLGAMYSTFETHGFVHEGTRERLARLGRPGGLTVARVAPTSMSREPLTRYGLEGPAVIGLALALAWRVLRLEGPWSQERLFAATTLARRPELPSLDDGQAYGLTHAAHLMTDFGARPHDVPEASRDYLAQNAERWAREFERRPNFDVFAELGLACCCLGLEASWAESGLRAVQKSDGMVPGPGLRSTQPLKGAGPERRQFLQNYHTTLASVMTSFGVTVGLARY